MHLRSSAIITGLSAAVLFTVSAGIARARSTPADRIVQTVDNAARTVIHGSVSPLARPDRDLGEVDGSFRLPNIRLMFKPTASQQAAITKLMGEQQDPKSKNFHKWLAPAQYGSQFGMSANDLDKVKAWLVSQGFTIEGTAPQMNSIAFSGTAAQVKAAFATPIHQYNLNGETRFANAQEISLPAAFSGAVAGVRGLHSFRPRPRSIFRSVRAGLKPDFTSSVTGNHFLAPADFATIYDINSLYSAGINGSGVTIAVMGQTDVNLNDMAEFRTASGLTANPPTVTTITGYTAGTSAGDVTEADLDLEWSGAVAPAATINYINAGDTQSVFDSLQDAIQNSVAPIISISYGACEPDWSSTDISTVETLLAEGNLSGITIVGPAGDDGATDCDNNDPTTPSDVSTMGLAVDYPASSASVTGIGGSEFTGDSTTGANTYWSATNSTSNGSALSYIPETVWNDTATEGELSGGGGGVSIYFSKPTWQVALGVPSDGARDVPDISLNASPAHDPYLICSSDYASSDPGATDCVTGFRASDQTLDVVGGTSTGPPSFSGILALIEQLTNSAQGNINYVLYPLYTSYPAAFHDITTGNNEQPCQKGSISIVTGTANCANGGSIGYSAGVGYDLASGLGSVDVATLAAAWQTISPTSGQAADFQVALTPDTLTVLAGASQKANVTVTALNGFTGTVSLVCAVGTSISSSTTCTLSPTTLTNSGTASLTVAVSSSGRTPPARPWKTTPLWPGLAVLAAGAAFYAWARFRPAGNAAFGRGMAVARWSFAAAILCTLLLGAAGCGGGSSSSSTTTTTTTTTTTPTNSVVTVTATSGSGTTAVSHTVQVSVTVN